MENLSTGDIVLFSAQWGWNPISWFSKSIEYFTKSQYSHIGIVLRDPIWIDEKLKGVYLWESSYNGTADPQDDKVKFGVQVTSLEQLINANTDKMWYRKLYHTKDQMTIFQMMNTHKAVYDKPYDLVVKDWIDAYRRRHEQEPHDDRFFCSALVAYIYTKCGILKSHTDWSIIRPSDFAPNDDKKYLHFEEGCSLSDLHELK